MAARSVGTLKKYNQIEEQKKTAMHRINLLHSSCSFSVYLTFVISFAMFPYGLLPSGTGPVCFLFRQPRGHRVQELHGAVSYTHLLARRSVARSGLDGRAAVLCASWTDLDGLLPREGFHLVVCNPPYFPPGSGRESASSAARLARHEQPGTLDEVVAAASRLLRLSLIHI